MLEIKMKTGNAAFRDERNGLHDEAVACQVRHIADMIDEGYRSGVIMDDNGNSCGKWSLS